MCYLFGGFCPSTFDVFDSFLSTFAFSFFIDNELVPSTAFTTDVAPPVHAPCQAEKYRRSTHSIDKLVVNTGK